MKLPLSIQIGLTLRRAVNALSPEGRGAIAGFVMSQKRENGYCGAGGQVEPYYTQFGELLESMLMPNLLWGGMKTLVPLMKRGFHVHSPAAPKQEREVLYDLFFRFINDELRWKRPCKNVLEVQLQPYRMKQGGFVHAADRPEASTNATCSALTMLHQVGIQDGASVSWLQDLQDETGGFRATADAPIPDLLSTGVAAFTLTLLGIKPRVPVTDFVESHWLENGGFAPTLLDEYSDVEYVFYGLLALGAQ